MNTQNKTQIPFNCINNYIYIEVAFISIKWIKIQFAVRRSPFFLCNVRHSPRRSLFAVAFQCPLTLSIIIIKFMCIINCEQL